MSQPKTPTSSGAKPAETKREDPGVPISLVLVLGILFYFGCNYINRHGGWFDPQVFEPLTTQAEITSRIPLDPEAKYKAMGKQVFGDSCVKCHGEDGMGKADQFPPLNGSDWVQNTTPNRIGRIVLNGLSGSITVQTPTVTARINAVMPPHGSLFDDEHLGAVLTYVRGNWSNKSGKITPEEITKIRAAIKDHPGPFTPAELLAIPDHN